MVEFEILGGDDITAGTTITISMSNKELITFANKLKIFINSKTYQKFDALQSDNGGYTICLKKL